MACRLTLLWLLYACAFAQTPPPMVEIPKLEGKIIRSANSGQVLAFATLLRNSVREAQVNGKPKPAVAKAGMLAFASMDKQDFNSAYRYGAQMLILLYGADVADAADLIASFDLKLDRSISEPGEQIGVVLSPLFDPGKPIPGNYKAVFTLQGQDGKDVGKPATAKITEYAEIRTVLATKNLRPGHYSVRYDLIEGKNTKVLSFSRKIYVAEGIDSRAKRLLELADEMAKSEQNVRKAAAIETIRYAAQIAQRARTDYVASLGSTTFPVTGLIPNLDLNRYYSEPFDVDRDLTLAESLADAVHAGKDPWIGRLGDMHAAYLSTIDSTLQPYRLFVPKNFDPAQKYPLIVALHGEANDENIFFDRFGTTPTGGENLIKKFADERGYIVVCPNGRGPFPGYTTTSERDVLDVIERVQKIYPISTLFLAGHSSGAEGAWLIGFQYPKQFAGIVAIAGAPTLTAEMLAKAPEMPVRLYEGADDAVVTPAVLRDRVKAAQDEMQNFQYNEYPDVDHFSIARIAITEMFRFFDSLSAKH